MKERLRDLNRYGIYRKLSVPVGVLLNVALAFLAQALHLPLYLDTAGTIGVTAVAGVLPGVITAVLTNALCSFFNDKALYYSIFNVLVAVATYWFITHGLPKKKQLLPILMVVCALIAAVPGMCFQWILLGGPQFEDVSDAARLFTDGDGFSFFLGTILVNVGLNFVDKTLTISLGMGAYYLIPKELRQKIFDSKWMQMPLSSDEISNLKKARKSRPIFRKIVAALVVVAVGLCAVMTWISLTLFSNSTMHKDKEMARDVAVVVAGLIDGDRVDAYIKKGRDAQGYLETEQKIQYIYDAFPTVKYLYVIQVDDVCTYVFDAAAPGVPGAEPGETTPIEDAFMESAEALRAGERIDPIVSDDAWGYLLTVYEPVKNSHGETVCYVGVDLSMNSVTEYKFGFIIQALMILSGFLVAILVYGMTISRYYLSVPISCMTRSAKQFVENGGDQDTIDEDVKRIRALEIHTGDEVEELYTAICKMESNIAEQLRDIRYFTNATAKMQNGLIITMADMVENRDSDTGAHIQKTAAYVRIILNGLHEKGYYAEKLTPKYMLDVESSAPLHDVGKINIPDAVLNKPGKLNEEEFEIMKTHTTAGKEILEKAITTIEGDNYLKEARNMAAYHHERWDGKGYPEGLHGEVIPLSARVMAVADVFDALTSPRVYKPAFPLAKALEIVQEGAGTQFDPKVVEVFMEHLPEVKRVLRKYHPETQEGM